tara:strand:+ start:546 stop:1217 length:672 start_codon:yes stop_codon:yes gene_type:complete
MEKLRFLLILVSIAILILWVGDYFLPGNQSSPANDTQSSEMDEELAQKLQITAQRPGNAYDGNGYVVITDGGMRGGAPLVLSGAFVLDDGRRGVFEKGGKEAKLESGDIVQVIDAEGSPLDSIIDTDKSVRRIVAFEALNDDMDTETTPEPTPEKAQSRIDGISLTQTSLLIPTGNEKEVGDMYEFYKKCNLHNEKTRAWKFHGSLATTVCADDSLDNCKVPE